MVDDPGELTETPEEVVLTRRRRRWRILGWAAAILALLVALAWLNRTSIVDRVVSGQLSSLGLPGKYKIESASFGTQVLTDIVIGDPAHPDLTIERAEVTVVPTFGMPTVGSVRLVRPRLYGTVADAKASFGSLDKLLFAKSEKPVGLPDMELELVDGRARLDTDYGLVGIKVEGKGNLSDGFSGILAATAPELKQGDCKLNAATLYGTVRITSAKPAFAGPLRFKALDCPGQGLKLADGAVQLDAATSERLDSVDGKFGLSTGALAWNAAAVRNLGGSGDFSFKGGDLTTRYNVKGTGISAGYANVGELTLEGLLRSHDGFARLEGEGNLTGSELAVSKDFDAALAQLAVSGKDTLIAPIAAQLRSGLVREGRGSKLGATYQLRSNAGELTLTIPRAVLRGGSGADVLSLSRVQVTAGGEGLPRISGNVLTGGAGLPQLHGRIERHGDGTAGARFTMAEYAAGDTRLSLPSLVLAQTRGGELGFSGRAELSGAVPDGRIDRLVVPLDGNWSARRGLSAWRSCTPLSFRSFKLANLTLDPRQLTLCPGAEGAILRSDARGTRIAALARSLSLAGRIKDTPLRLASGPVAINWPGKLSATTVAVEVGSVQEPTTVKLAQLTGVLGKEISGTFTGAEIKLSAVPLDLFDGSGQWRFADSDLAVSEAAFRLEDRAVDDRFRPLIAHGAEMHLHGSDFTATAMLREPRSDREVVKADIAHDMDDGKGHAILTVPGLVFDNAMQPDTLTALALGVIANARGTVTGSGRIDWDAVNVTSTGTFSTQGLDFAAAFGPTKGLRGTVEFSDLLGLVTKRDQKLQIASINPGIEVDNGEVSFQLEGNNVLVVNGANWPFVDGTLELLPTRMVLGASEVRRYTLRLRGANAAKFVQQLELGNVSAEGIFDGDIPIVFDEN
uniref:intermembrane phospholipid transport protein YdbH family protein n=1 Tax=Novosphingobium sp. TaxID=1874826 RepID=UPI0035B1475B